MEINNTKKQIRMQSKESYAVDESSRVYQAVMYLTEYVAQMQVVQEVLAQNNPEIWLDIKKKMQERLQ